MSKERFAVIIVTYGRADDQATVKSLKTAGYTGPVLFVVDDGDSHLPRYIERYGAAVKVFSKRAIGKTFDVGDNFEGYDTVVYARQAVWGIAEAEGITSFVVLDDDYDRWEWRFNEVGRPEFCRVKSADAVFAALVQFLRDSGAHTVALGQGGDYIGGPSEDGPRLRRKAMNSFVCLTDRRFDWLGNINEDVSTYVGHGRKGLLFFTTDWAMLHQRKTQAGTGGMTGAYLAVGTYTKSFYSVMHAPSCVTVYPMGDSRSGAGALRLHHRIDWRAAVPLIIGEKWAKQ